MDIQVLEKLFEQHFKRPSTKTERLPGAGSDRIYYRLYADTTTAIGVINNSVNENNNFLLIDKFLGDNGICVPAIYEISEDGLCYLQQDLGNSSLFSLLHEPNRNELIEKTLISLAKIHSIPMTGQISSLNPPFDHRLVHWDLNYFKYCFLKPTGVDIDENSLEDDFERFSQELLSNDMLYGFMYRDCQSRNVMIFNDEPWWIDFQGARRGPVAYDVASFLWQAKAGLSAKEREHFCQVYCQALKGYIPIDARQMMREIKLMAAFRTLQVLGAYGLRGLTEKKAHFLESIPAALDNLHQIVADGVFDTYPELKRLSFQLIDMPRFKPATNKHLCVEVYSFSYKKGYPEDLTGNGGGFMFDCRYMHNPGRYIQYASLTGMDKPVIDFLEERGEVQPFLESALYNVKKAVERYHKRGFTHLQIGYGCTGGRHRSVYCAQKTAETLANLYPDVEIKLIHREQNIIKTFNSPNL
jgi:aminoglycoside/choline kinase family phosphotransferase